tara:strand:- start:16266 stop:16649 length:384 start_codon:yes stop_codon:yes gene_type:complete
MMAGFYDEMATVALELISEFGQAGQIKDEVPGSYDPVTGDETGGSTSTQDAQMILLDYTSQEAGAKYAAGTEVKVGDKKILIASKGLDSAPLMTSLIHADGADWRVQSIKISNPAGTPLAYEIHGRK